MNTRQIDSILRSDPYAQSVFRGVFARDKSPQKVGWPGALVWNLDTSKNPLVRIGWQSTLIRADVVTILTATVCHLCTKI